MDTHDDIKGAIPAPKPETEGPVVHERPMRGVACGQWCGRVRVCTRRCGLAPKEILINCTHTDAGLLRRTARAVPDCAYRKERSFAKNQAKKAVSQRIALANRLQLRTTALHLSCTHQWHPLLSFSGRVSVGSVLP